MVSLGEILSEKSKKKMILPTIKSGDIFRMKLTEKEGITPKNKGDIDRNKYFVVIHKTIDDTIIGFLVINTNINHNLSETLQMLHYPISAKKYSFLKNDSFIYCGELKEISSDTFVEKYKNESFGCLDSEDMKYIIDALLDSPIETDKHLKKFGIKE
jgi:hypothetical protein